MHTIVRTFRATIVEGRFIPLIISLLIIGMRTAMFFLGGMPQASFANDSFLWNYAAPLFADPIVSFVASTMAVFLIAWIISSMNSRFALIRSRSTLPFVVPLFLFSLHPWFLVMTGDYVSIILILLAFFPLLKSYQNPDSYLYSFRAGILIAMASLFQVYALALFPLWWVGERSMRGYQFRSFLSSVFGVLLIYVSLFSLYFFYDNIEGFLHPFLSFASFSIPAVPVLTLTEWGILVLIGLLFLLNMVFSISTYSRDKVLTLSFMQFVVFLIVFLLLLQVVYWSKTLFFLMLSIALVSFLNAYFYTRTASKTNIILAFIILSLMLLYYLSHLFPHLLLLQ